MIEVYSNNVSVDAGAAVPLNNEVLRKGCTATKSGNTINLNRSGVYQVNCSCTASAAGTLQLQRNNVLQPQAQLDMTNSRAASFSALVQVSHNNCPCDCNTAPVSLNVVNTGTEAVPITTFNLTVTKLC